MLDVHACPKLRKVAKLFKARDLNSRQRRSRRRLEEFRKQKRSLDAPESANGRRDRRLQDPAPSKPPQSEDRSRPGHALAEKFPADFRLLDPKEQPSVSSNSNGHGSKEITRDQKDSNNDAMTAAMTRFDTSTGSNPISDGATTRIGKLTSSATTPGSSLTHAHIHQRVALRRRRYKVIFERNVTSNSRRSAAFFF